MDKMRHANVRINSQQKKNVMTILETRTVLTDLSKKRHTGMQGCRKGVEALKIYHDK